MNIISYNVNGIRAALKKGFDEWLTQENPDIVCLQEVKAQEEQVDISIFQALGYHVYWHAAQKKGYSGVAIFSKQAAKNVAIGCGNDLYDSEGRVIRIDFEDFSVLNTYMPSGSSGDIRQDFKMQWLDFFINYAGKLKEEIPNLIICGDYNICHKPIDIHDPVSNKNSSGFLPEEREWMSQFVASGFIDSFRHFHEEPDRYSWWSYRARSRERNKGWRIDYHMVTDALKERLIDADILDSIVHSDHCPIQVKIQSKLD
jgi:exodeoxyribonuclease-3